MDGELTHTTVDESLANGNVYILNKWSGTRALWAECDLREFSGKVNVVG
jgi:hypothetical protein